MDKRRAYTAMLLILLIAAALRFHNLGVQSFWYDEGNSARIVERTPRLIIEAAGGDIHPPGYYLALAAWRLPTGFSEFALRSFSVFWGLLTVALSYALGRRLSGLRVGLAGALIVAVHAFHIYYAQEARMYTMLAALGAGSMYAFVRWLFPDPRASKTPSGTGMNREAGRKGVCGIAWALLNAAGLYTQYAYPVVMLVQGIVFLLWWAKERHARRFAQYVGYNLITLLLFLPWLPTAVRQITTWPTSGGAPISGTAPVKVGALLLYGGASHSALWVAALLLGVMAMFAPRREAWHAVLLWLWALLPPLGMFALGLYRPAFLKALLVGHVPLALLMGCGIVAVARKSRLRYLILLAALVLVLSGKTATLYDAANYRADYRAMARHIEADARPGDAVLLDAANQWEVFTYYHRAGAPVYPIPRTRPVDVDATLAELDDILADHCRLYVLYWGDAESDPDLVVEGYLNTHAFALGTTWYKDVRMVTYALPPRGDVPIAELDARFVGGLRLTGYVLHVPEPLRPGSALTLSLFWAAEDAPDGRYKVFVHLADANGVPIAQHDAEPGGLVPTDAWEAGQEVVDNHGLLVPADAAPGEYRLVVGLYRVEDPSARLPLLVDGEPAEDALQLATLTVAQ